MSDNHREPVVLYQKTPFKFTEEEKPHMRQVFAAALEEARRPIEATPVSAPRSVPQNVPPLAPSAAPPPELTKAKARSGVQPREDLPTKRAAR